MSPHLRIPLAIALVPVGYLASGAVRWLARQGESPGVRTSLEMLGVEVGLIFFALALALALPGSPRERLGLEPGRLPWSAVVALVIGTLGLSAALEGVLALTRAAELSKISGISRSLAQTPWSMVGLALLGTAVAPGVAEELLCRGLVQRTVARWTPAWLAVVLGALFFGWLHQEWVHGSIAAVLGLYLGVGALWADSTRPAMAAHTVNNALALLGSLGMLHLPGGPVAAIAVGGILAAGGLAWAARCRAQTAAGRSPSPEAPALPLQPGSHSADS